MKEPAAKRFKTETGETHIMAAAAATTTMKGLDDEIANVKKAGNRTYYVFDMQVPGAIFIKIADWARPHIDVKRVGLDIVTNVKETGELSTRFVNRFFPVDFLCKANNFKDFKQMALPVLQRYFPMASDASKPNAEDREHVQWCLEFKKRNNDKVNRKAYVDYLMSVLDPTCTSVSYDYADVEVIVEVFRDQLIFTVLPGYKRDFKKFNLQMLAGNEDAE